jgi:acetyl esterase/lipase
LKLSTSILCILTILYSSFFLSAAPKKKKFFIPNNIQLISNIEYKNINKIKLHLDLYLPKNMTQPLPLVVWIHGGGWKNGSKERPKGIWLAQKGYAFASINYRLTHEAIWPAQIDDCRDAVRFLRKNANKFKIDPAKIAVWGGSAGGHLAAVYGTQEAPLDEPVSSKVQAVIDWYGPSDLLSMPPNNISETRTLEQVANSNGAKLLGSTVKDVPDLAKEASAFWNVSKNDPPFLIMHGEKDPGVPIKQSERLHKKLLQEKVPSTFYIVKGAGHGGPLFQTEDVKQIMLSFLGQVF